MIWAGFDLGITKANPVGFSIVDFEADNEPLLLLHSEIYVPDLGCPETKDNWTQRLDLASAWIQEKLDQLYVDAVAYEYSWISTNPQVGMQLATLGGCVRTLARLINKPCWHVTNAECKSVMGLPVRSNKKKGIKVTKEMMVNAVEQRFGPILIKDAADAVAVCLAGAKRREQERLAFLRGK